MTLQLRIDNFDQLPDGSPLDYQVNGSGFTIGRESVSDWALPDPSRHISRTHCEVKFEQGGYWLYDLSANGVFLNGASGRMKSPHALENNDRVQIGNYVIAVTIGGQQQAAQPAAPVAQAPAPPPSYAAPPPSNAPAVDDWGIAVPAAAPAPASSVSAPQSAAGFIDDHVDFPAWSDTPASPAPPPQAPAPAPSESPFAPAAAPPPVAPPAPPIPPAPTAPVAEAFSPAPQRQAAAPVAHAPPSAGSSDVLRAICEGAGLPPDTFAGVDPSQAAVEIGKALRIAAEDVSSLLKGRAATKLSVKSGSRTMINATENNPLKFIPNTPEAMAVMFGAGREGYLKGGDSMAEALDDIKKHQYATYAAIQPALARLIEDLSPEAVESKISSRMGSRKAKAWELFVERWDAKTHPYDNGMLDVFMAYFAEAYDEASKKK